MLLEERNGNYRDLMNAFDCASLNCMLQVKG